MYFFYFWLTTVEHVALQLKDDNCLDRIILRKQKCLNPFLNFSPLNIPDENAFTAE